VEERLKKLEQWAAKTGKILNKLQRENERLKAKVETMERLGGVGSRDYQVNKAMNDVFGGLDYEQCAGCKERTDNKAGHLCKDGQWKDHSKMRKVKK
jgi:hypothetical protein